MSNSSPFFPDTMMAVVTTGTGGYDKLSYQPVPTPVPGTGEVLLRVRAAGMNNTEINTRLGWYSSSVTDSTDTTSTDGERADGGWNNATPFPFIQGTDCCGEVVAAGPEAKTAIGTRVLVRACMRERGFDHMDNIWMGSDFDGAFAQYVKVPASEVFPVSCGWSDAELATIPCAYGTAENMVHRAGVGAGHRVLIPGASGGVGSALVQLVKRRGAEAIAITSASKRDTLMDVGADKVLLRDDDLLAELGEQSVDVVIDNVAGAGFGTLLKLLRRGGRYASSGAIAGPIVDLDMRDMYLKDIRLIGCTAWDEPVFPNLVGYIERGEIKPLLAQTFPLRDIAHAQEVFQQKGHVGKFVLIPPE
ncbi:NADPH:quinone reductase-like Zn-dependent oxidoreductase [Shimia isoporae]|uniref:NADPH:quinone reductase-like Zn-dependent oxidoreductase n=1 Tax=Shimia isoporae TaxID=647720 RepID=A0A4V2Q3P4_9RHOB|nr:alcohol dehydrogenase family protein [Shimia isoporae]TCL07980.1 NADPH:quinone reductase-like Zn-dependent oxidoreductase [Shimia isoporae]